MRVLILGAAGFLGRHVNALLRDQPDLQVQAAPRRHDLDLGRASPAQWTGLLDATRPDVVVNCAGCTDGTVDDLHCANTALVGGLVHAVLGLRAPPRIIHLGSAAEYGPGLLRPTEDAPTRPASLYGASKLRGTQVLLSAPAQVARVVLRPFNPVGAGQAANTVAGRAARQFRQAVAEGESAVAFGNLSAERDFIAACDVARAVLTVLRRADAPAVLNVGRGEGRPVREIVQTLALLSGFRGEVREDAPGSGRSGSVSRQWADTGRLRTLGWLPVTPLDDALGELWWSTLHGPLAASIGPDMAAPDMHRPPPAA